LNIFGENFAKNFFSNFPLLKKFFLASHLSKFFISSWIYWTRFFDNGLGWFSAS